jgi:hypothetical protein
MSCTVASRTASRPPAAAKHRSYPAITAADTRVSRAGPQLSPLASDQPSFLRHDIPAVGQCLAHSCRLDDLCGLVPYQHCASLRDSVHAFLGGASPGDHTAGSSAIPASANVGALADPLSTFHGDRKPVG